MTLQLTIVVPAFDEAHRLTAGMRRLDAAVAAGAVDVDRTEVLVVDDGSNDETAAVAEKLLAALPHHRLLRLPRNQGKGAAVRAGVAASRTPYTAYMDADMAIDPLAVPLLLDGLAHDDVAIGCRALRDSMVETSYVVRSLIGRLFNELVTAGTGLGLKDTQCGFKAFRTPTARLLFHLVRIDRFAFDVEILARARRLGLGITEVPVHWMHVEGAPSTRSMTPGPCCPTCCGRGGDSCVGRRCPPSPSGRRVRRPGRAGRPHPRVTARLAPVLDGAPVPLVRGASGVTVLLAMVDPVWSTGPTPHCATACGRVRDPSGPRARGPGGTRARSADGCRRRAVGPTRLGDPGPQRRGTLHRVSADQGDTGTAPPAGHPDDADLIEAIVEHADAAASAPATPAARPTRSMTGDARATGATVSYLPVAARRPGSTSPWPTTTAVRTSTSGAGRSTCGPSCAGCTTRSTSTGSGSSGRAWRRSPPVGGALIVANHAGAIPSDAPAIMHGIETELGRPVYGLADYFFRTVPVVGTLWSRTGGVPAHPDNAYRILHDQQQLAMVFPEGTKATPRRTPTATGCAGSGGAASWRSPCGPGSRWSRSPSSVPRSRCRSCSGSPGWPRPSISPTSR